MMLRITTLYNIQLFCLHTTRHYLPVLLISLFASFFLKLLFNTFLLSILRCTFFVTWWLCYKSANKTSDTLNQSLKELIHKKNPSVYLHSPPLTQQSNMRRVQTWQVSQVKWRRKRYALTLHAMLCIFFDTMISNMKYTCFYTAMWMDGILQLKWFKTEQT